MLPATLRPTFSFYVGPSIPHRITAAAACGDAVTVAGKGGPEAIRDLRRRGNFQTPVIFDRRGYELGADPVDLAEWIDEQRSVGADRVLTAGRLARYSKSEPTAWHDEVRAELALGGEFEATALIALDARILARFANDLVAIAGEYSAPLAIVLIDGADPLSHAGATDGLIRVARGLANVSLLRSDHGSIAVPAFGGAHASIGLAGYTRHYSMGRGRAKPTKTNRVFVRYYLDWFTADLIAGWSAAGRALNCDLPCCGGQPLDRFFDDRLDPLMHNMHAIAEFADYVLNADPVDRPRTFLDTVAQAHAHYDINGIHGPVSKPQLNSWALL
jgi:hypothetical protein